MGQDDVKISDLWEDFFLVCVCGFILNPSHWGSFIGLEAFGAEDLEDLEGHYHPNLIR